MADEAVTLLDTSAAVAFVVADHSAHESTWRTLSHRSLGLAGHAWFETFSVLTRLPGASRRDASTVVALLDDNFPETRFLDSEATADLTSVLAPAGIAGGSVYDALVAKAAQVHGLPLASRDRRARDTYRLVGAEVELLD